jgi:two-component system nitrate/nitrite sensor histidine kinase NarX
MQVVEPKERRRRTIPVELDRLRWIAVVLPVAFILLIEALRQLLIERDSTQQPGHLALAGMMLVGVVTFSLVMFFGIEATQRHLVRQNRELAAVDAVSTAIQGELGLDLVIDAALGSVMASTDATEASILVFPQDGAAGGEPGLERHRVAGPHASPMPGAGQVVPHLIDIPLSTGTSVLGRMLLHLPEGAEEPDLLATATLNNIGHQLASAIQIRQLVLGLQRRQLEDHRLYDILLNVADQGPLVEVLATIVRDARELLGAEEAAMCLSDLGSRALADDDPRTVDGLSPGSLACVHGEGPRVSVHDRQHPCHVRSSVDGGQVLEVPVRGPDGAAYGSFWLGRRAGPEFTEGEKRLLVALSDVASIALTGARARESERQGAIVAERERIAREMHDSLAQVLGVTHLRLRRLVARSEIADLEPAATEIGDLADLVEEAYRDVREAILGLREASQTGRTLADSIAAYLARYGKQAGLDARLENDLGDDLALPPRVEVQLIRVIQEALTNVRKHGGATRVVVRIVGRDDGVRIAVEDDGRGFDVGGTLLGRDGFGLYTMRERMSLIGGTLSIESAPGRGTTIVADVPAVRAATLAR